MMESAIAHRPDLQNVMLDISHAFLQKMHACVDQVRNADAVARRKGPVVERNAKNAENEALSIAREHES